MHGLGLKTVPGKKTKKIEISDFNKFDYVSFTSEFTKNNIGKKLFKIKSEKLIILGYPRYDQYFNKKKITDIQKKKDYIKIISQLYFKEKF